MRQIIAAVLGITALGVAFGPGVRAADMPVKAPVKVADPVMPANWTACYIGGNIGTASAKMNFATTQGVNEGSHNATGLVGGGQVGCDYQFASSFVIGVQGMYDWADMKGSNASLIFPTNILNTTVRSFGTLTGRLGILPIPTVLLYGKGGFAWVNNRYLCNGTGGCVTTSGGLGYSVSEHRNGWDVGAGVSWMFAPHWDVWVEYDHIGGLGTKTMTFTSNNGNGAFFRENIGQSIDKVLVGVDYRFSLLR